jgi:rubrerythrin
MGVLKKEPAGRVASAEELMAIAHAMEREAARRYHGFADRMRLQGEDNLAALFTFLAGIEEKHAHQVDVRARLIVGKSPDAASVKWDLPESFDRDEAPAYLLTPYRALAIAVRNEERAFAFFSYLAAGAEDERVRQLAEEFAKDELDHAALLRRERRKAWRRTGARGPFTAGSLERPESLSALRAQAAAMEHAAAEGHRVLAVSLRARGNAAMATLFEKAAADEAACAQSLEAQTEERETGIRLEAEPGNVRDGLRILEFAFERYSDIVDRTENEQVMNEAQALSERALRRLAGIEGMIGNTLIEAATVRE